MYVRRHHPVEQIIHEKEARTRSSTCLVNTFEPKTVYDALEN